MRITKASLNDRYKRFCTNKELDPMDEESTKAFMKWYMDKNNLTHVKQDETHFHFLKASRK